MVEVWVGQVGKLRPGKSGGRGGDLQAGNAKRSQWSRLGNSVKDRRDRAKLG